MEIKMEWGNLKNEVLRKIGRNVILFQQIEHILKHLLVSITYSGYASNLKTNIEQRTSAIHKQTMGQVANKFIKDMYLASDSEEKVNVSEELTEIFFSFNCKIKCDNSYYEERKNALALVVTERNDLIHHLLLKWNINSFESIL